jgi:hypothetical protein
MGSLRQHLELCIEAPSEEKALAAMRAHPDFQGMSIEVAPAEKCRYPLTHGPA